MGEENIKQKIGPRIKEEAEIASRISKQNQNKKKI